MKLRVMVLAAGLLLPVPAFSQQPVMMADLLSGNDLFNYCSGKSIDICTAYIAGVSDAVTVFNAACVPAQVDSTQVKDIATRYLTAHPERRHLQAARVVVLAVQMAFPCE